MTISYNLVPIPRWYFADFAGLPLGGGFMQAWSSLDPTAPKVVFQDEGGVNAWPTQTITIGQLQFPNAILFDANGEQGPFYWEFDTSNTSDLYFLQIYDKNGNLQFTVEDYGAPGGGGGGTVTTNNFLKNYVVNNVFWRNLGTLANIQSGTVICPSAHEGFQFSDMQFIRSNNSATDKISFVPFSAGSVPLTGDVTPEYYLDFYCSAAGTETSKTIRIPIDLHVKNLEQQQMTAIIWAKTGPNGGNQSFSVQGLQSFGTGAGSSNVAVNAISSQTATNTWTAYAGTFIWPSVVGKSLGAGGDDATYLEIVLTAGGSGVGDILFAKPKLYLGQIAVFPELDTYDQVDTVISSSRTGDFRSSLNSFVPGWVAANDGTIGDPSSGATTRANQDAWQLYSLIWNNFLDNWAPVVGGRGATAIADFAANKPITLTRNLGRVIAGSNPLFTTMTFTASSVTSQLTISSSTNLLTGSPVLVSNSGGALPSPLAANTIYFAINTSSNTLQLATTVENAYGATPITLTTNGTGTQTIQSGSGAYFGESNHVLVGGELPSPIDGTVTTVTVNAAAGGQAIDGITNSGGTPTNTRFNFGSNTGHNTIQLTTYQNVFIKL